MVQINESNGVRVVRAFPGCLIGVDTGVEIPRIVGKFVGRGVDDTVVFSKFVISHDISHRWVVFGTMTSNFCEL